MTDGRRRAALRGFLKKHRALLASVLLLAALIALLARAGGRSDRYIVEAEYDEGAQQLRVLPGDAIDGSDAQGIESGAAGLALGLGARARRVLYGRADVE